MRLKISTRLRGYRKSIELTVFEQAHSNLQWYSLVAQLLLVTELLLWSRQA